MKTDKIIKERLGNLTHKEKEIAIIALGYLTEVSHRKYGYEFERTNDLNDPIALFRLTIYFEHESDIFYFYKFYGAGQQYYQGYFSHWFSQFAIKGEKITTK